MKFAQPLFYAPCCRLQVRPAHLLVTALLMTPVPAVAAVDDIPKWTVQPATTAGPSGKANFSYEGQPGQQFDDSSR